jgi:DNA polymerase-3 subunit epsilon
MHEQIPLWAQQLAVFDTETTGISIGDSRVVSATVALIGGSGEVRERYDWLLDPGVEIPATATEVHGITTELARANGTDAAVGISQIVAQLISMSERGFPIVAYNAPFDLSLLRAEATRHNVAWPGLGPVLDPLVLDKQVDRFRKGKRTLTVASAHYGVSLVAAHDAGADAIAAGHVLQAIAARYVSELPDELTALHDAQVGWAATQAESLQQYLRRVKDPAAVVDGGWPIRGK